MKLTTRQKRELIEAHPDRHGGDHSMLGRFFAAIRRPSQAMDAIRRCVHCGVRIGGQRTCQVHRYVRHAIAGLLLATSAVASDVRLAWDASPSPAVTNYVLYAHTNSLSATNLATAAVKANCGTNLTALVEGLKPAGATWYFVATAQAGGVQSDPSNQVIIQVPVPPPGARTVAIEYGITLTNFSDVGFFRLRIPSP